MDDSKPQPTSPSGLSKTPSWISLGFILGVIFVWFLPKPAPEVVEVATRNESPPPLVATLTKPDFSELEAVFADWDKYAIWENDTTEVALWDIDTSQYARFYEVLRSGNQYYYRSIAGLNRPLLTHGVPVNAPLLFTEPQARRDEWVEQQDGSKWKAITDSIQKKFPTTPPKPEIRK